MRRLASALAALSLCSACLVPADAPGARATGVPSGPPRPTNPSEGEIELDCAADWDARLLFDNGATGIWTVGAYPVFPMYATDEIVGLDDAGVCHVLVTYSGKWKDFPRVHDGLWLGGIAFGDVDARADGSELYVGGQSGNVYQVRSHPHEALDARFVAHLPGREVHTLVAGELDPRSDGPELLAFTSPGGLWRIAPTGEHGAFDATFLEGTPGRVRDAVALPPVAGRGAEVATAGREGRLALLSIGADGPRWSEIHAEPTGMGRLALKPPAPGEVAADGTGTVLYCGLDDGRVLRCERRADDWDVAPIFQGPVGLRGVAAGRFHADPGVESLAVFGYSSEVFLVTRGADGAWESERLFEDRERGHWLAGVEVDGRNATRELVGSGYGGRIFLLTRPPGYGLE